MHASQLPGASGLQPVICVNSTLAGQAEFVRHGDISPIHGWGFRRAAGDAVLCHRLNRYEVVFRARMCGLDLRVLGAVLWRLLRGYRSVYLVTPPDLLVALPLLRRLFPRMRAVTWAWTEDDVMKHRARLTRCAHVFCLTEGALRGMQAEGIGDRASLEIWGADPDYYACAPAGALQPWCDVALLGQTLRDMDLAAAAIARGGLSVGVTARVAPALRAALRGDAATARIVVKDAATHREVVEMFHRSRVTWIPLRAGDRTPSGYTNLAESLLCGTPAVIADSSILPQQVLALPGVFRYRVGDVASFLDCTRAAIDAGQRSGYRAGVRDAAVGLLDGRALRRRVEQLLR
jgi:hypothetical protein